MITNNVSLSGNSISDTYMSVLQLSLSGDGVIKDGGDNVSQFKVDRLDNYNNKSIKMGNLEYPSMAVINNGVVIGSDVNKMGFSEDLKIQNNNVYINNVYVPQDFLPDLNGVIIIGSNGATINTMPERNYEEIVQGDFSVNGKTTINVKELLSLYFKVDTSIEGDYVITRLWILGSSTGLQSGNSFSYNQGYINYQNVKYNINGICYNCYTFPYTTYISDSIEFNQLDCRILKLGYIRI